jgi:hypothetical protein
MAYYKNLSAYMKVLPLIYETPFTSKTERKKRKKAINGIIFHRHKKHMKNYANINNVSVSYYNTYRKRKYENDYRYSKILRQHDYQAFSFEIFLDRVA